MFRFQPNHRSDVDVNCSRRKRKSFELTFFCLNLDFGVLVAVLVVVILKFSVIDFYPRCQNHSHGPRATDGSQFPPNVFLFFFKPQTSRRARFPGAVHAAGAAVSLVSFGVNSSSVCVREEDDDDVKI